MVPLEPRQQESLLKNFDSRVKTNENQILRKYVFELQIWSGGN
jgi:hypothetical protein